MSETYTDYIGSQSIKTWKTTSVHTDASSGKSLYVPRDRIPWSEEVSNELVAFFNKIYYPYRNFPDIPFEEPLRSEIRRFLLSLDAYKDSPNPVIPDRVILMGSTQKNYATILKRIRRKAFQTTWGVEYFEMPDWWEETPQYTIRDIGDIFNYSYLIFWEEDVDDYKNGFIPVSIKPESISLFKEHLKGLLPERDSFSKIDSQEVLSELSSSMSMERGNPKPAPYFQIKHKYLRFSEKRGLCRRSIVPVSPCNIRDTVINDPSDLNTISLIDRQVMQILSRITGHVHLTDKDRCTRRYKRLYKKYTKFLHRDMKKEGITKPRELLTAMLEVLYEEYPDIEIFRYTRFYENFELSVDGETLFPKRGHGLGMANALTTLMQLVIHEMVLDRLLDDIPDIDSDILCINDDFVAGFNDDYHLDSYWDMEHEIMEELSIIREPSKSFRSERCFVLAERYFTPKGEYEKISYQLRDLLLPLSCTNVVQAKTFFIAAQTYVNSRLVPHYMDEIRSFWGYEFYPNEFEYPAIVGGWILEKVNSVDMSLVLLDSLEYKSYVSRGFKAINTQMYKKKGSKLFTPPLLYMNNSLIIPEELERIFDVIPYEWAKQKYGRILKHNPKNFEDFWNKLYKVRQRAFKKPYDITYEDLLIEIKKSRPATQFYPAPSMIESYLEWDINQIVISDPYIDPNPKVAALAKFNSSINYPFKETFSIQFSELDGTTKQSLSLFSKEVQRSLKTEYLSLMFSGRYHEFFWPKESTGFDPSEQYINPIKIGEITSLINWGRGYPKMREQFKDILVEQKREIFGRFLSLKELELISRERLTRSQIKILLDFCKETGETFSNVIDFLKEEVQKTKEERVERVEKDPPIPENLISVPRLLGEGGSGIFYAWRSAPDEWIFQDEESKNALGLLSRFVIEYTFPNLRSEDEKKQIKSEVDAGLYGDLVRILHQIYGLSSLLDQANMYEAWGSDEDLGLFADEEGW